MADESTRAQLEIDPAVGTVEIKITARARDEDEVLEALEQAHVEPEAREVYFFNTADLTLFEAGIVLRARRVHEGADDSTVKLRPVDSKSIGERWKADPKLEFEVDAVGDNYVSSAKLSADQDRGEIDEVARGERSVRSLFSGDQEQFLGDYVPERFVDFLRSRGFDTEGEQLTKTRTALEYLTGKSLD